MVTSAEEVQNHNSWLNQDDMECDNGHFTSGEIQCANSTLFKWTQYCHRLNLRGWV